MDSLIHEHTLVGNLTLQVKLNYDKEGHLIKKSVMIYGKPLSSRPSCPGFTEYLTHHISLEDMTWEDDV